ncbi:MAG: UDP-N-acetylmuramate--L-alanine ligase, partial [Synergistetes bacterium]|nr:UDP-N-acetylmuramate--L-alanine ligase [Synergistota bacterium]
HLEHYRWDIKNLYDAFVEVAGKVPDDGWVVLCGEHPSASFLQEALGNRGRRIVRYGFKDDMDAVAKDIDFCGIGSEYDFFWREERVGRVRLKIPGIHNVLNSLAVLSLVKLLGLDVDRAFEALSKFRGAHRRFELVGEANGVKVFDDYAHHPSEIEATLRAARNVWPDRRLVVVFQPHRYTRTKALYRGFAKALSIADFVIITDIYPADEAPIEGVSSMLIVDSMRKIGYTNVKYISWGDILDVFSAVKIGDVLFTIGAGNVYKVGESILSRLQEGTDGF